MWALNHAFLRAHNKPMWYIYIYIYHIIWYIYISYIYIYNIHWYTGNTCGLATCNHKVFSKKEWIAQWSTCCSEETAVKCWETILRWQTAANNTARRLIRSGNLSQQWKTPPLISASECFPGLKLGVSWSFHDIQPLSQIQERAPTQESERLFILKISQDLSVKEVAHGMQVWNSCELRVCPGTLVLGPKMISLNAQNLGRSTIELRWWRDKRDLTNQSDCFSGSHML